MLLSLAVLPSSSSVRHFTVLKCDKSEAKSWDELWKSGEVDRNQDSLQHTQKDVRTTKGGQHSGGGLPDGQEVHALDRPTGRCLTLSLACVSRYLSARSDPFEIRHSLPQTAH